MVPKKVTGGIVGMRRWGWFWKSFWLFVQINVYIEIFLLCVRFGGLGVGGVAAQQYPAFFQIKLDLTFYNYLLIFVK